MRRFLILALFLSTPASAAETINYSYDAAGRLMKVARSGTVNNGISACYYYDRADNRRTVKVATSDCSNSPELILYAGQAMWSPDARFQLSMEYDGNLVLYTQDAAVWSTGTIGGSDRRMVMQADGNLVVYNSADQALWMSGTYGNPGARLSLQTDGNLVIFSSSNAVLWQTSTVYEPPSFSISDVSVTEGGNFGFTVTRSRPSNSTYTVNFSTADGTATGGSDYYAGPGSISFAPSETTKPITIGTIDDTTVEGAETVLVNLTGVSLSGTISDGQGVGTINDNDGGVPSSFSVNNVAANEGDLLQFVITRSGGTSTAQAVTVWTSNGTAGASDYSALAATQISFAVGEYSRSVNIATIDNYIAEFPENMHLNLSNPTNGATISDNQGTGTIYDNDQDEEEGGGGCPPSGCP